MNKFQVNSPIEISGLDDNLPYIEMTTRLCWLDHANLNGVGLSSTAEESFKTLIGMPVVAKINSDGTKFGSHEVSIDDKGEIKFNTSAYGVHTDVWVAEDEVDIPNVGLITVPCLFAKSKIWKRFSSVVNLIVNKMTNPDEHNGGLWSSWELQGEEHHLNDNGEKIYDKFAFLANTLIDVQPAYSTTSKTLLIASNDFENELSNAYMDDLDKNKLSEALDINKPNKEDTEMSKKTTDTSALTTRDLHQKAYEALNPKGWNSNPYYSVWEIYPEEHKILAYDIDRASEDEYLVFTYTVAEDVLTVGEGVSTKLSKILAEKTNVSINVDLNDTAKLLSEKESLIKSLTDEKDQLTSQLAEKDATLVSASEKVNELQSSVEELTPFKEKVEAIEQAQKEAEIAQKREELKKYILESELISPEEIETSEEIKNAIEAVDQTVANSIIAQRFMQKLKSEKSNQPPVVETSETKSKENVKTNLIMDEDVIDHKAVMSSFLKK